MRSITHSATAKVLPCQANQIRFNAMPFIEQAMNQSLVSYRITNQSSTICQIKRKLRLYDMTSNGIYPVMYVSSMYFIHVPDIKNKQQLILKPNQSAFIYISGVRCNLFTGKLAHLNQSGHINEIILQYGHQNKLYRVAYHGNQCQQQVSYLTWINHRDTDSRQSSKNH